LYHLWRRFLPLQLMVIVGTVGLIAGVSGGLIMALIGGGINRVPLNAPPPAPAPLPADLSPVFTAEVQYWKPFIMRWAQQYNVEPNILGTVIQIESCGHYQVGSPAGAQGLFQVMPFHFADGEDMKDPETNAKRGIAYLKGGLELADGHIGLAMAGYNGGWGVIPRGWAGWYNETRRYYIWGSGIYQDALKGKQTHESEALQDWLNAGGSILCGQANALLFPRTPTPPVVTN
jgi:hypothetical protein